MVPKRSDYHFDLLHFPQESKEDGLKQTMVNQENTFRKQVQELHRVYKMQMYMMKNSRSNEMSETQYMYYSQDGFPGKWSQRFQNREFPTNYRNGLGTQEKPIDVECYFHGETTKSRTEELSLSLNIGVSDKKIWEENITPSSLHIIDLEESPRSLFKKDYEPGSGFVSNTKNIHEGISGNTKRSLSFLDAKSFLNQGVKVFTNSKAKLLDLNEPPCDESSLYVNNDHTGIRSPVIDSELVVGCQESMILDSKSCIKPNDNIYTPSSVLTPPSSNGGSNLSSIDLESCGKEVRYENSEDQECGLKLGSRNSNGGEESVEWADVDMCPVSIKSSNSLKTMQSTSNLQLKGELGLKSVCRNSNVEEDSVEKADTDMLPISSNPSNSLKTMQLGLKSGYKNSNVEEDSVVKADIDMFPISNSPSNTLKTMQSVAYSESSTPVMNSIQNSESSQINSLGNGDEQSVALDDNHLIRRGAVSLLYLNICQNSSSKQNHSIHENQPEHSVDSFESAVLKLRESKLDDLHDVSSNHYYIDGGEKDSPIKLRRGRRMKDFQKDILPSMSSLSRHEICQDLRLMEGVIRSREYKRLRPKDSDDQKWFTPVKSRRSRLNNISRKS